MIDEMLEAAREAHDCGWGQAPRNNFERECTTENIIALCEFVKAFGKWHDHKDAYSHTYETAYTEMVMAWRKLL